FDFHGRYYNGERIEVIPKPYQQPLPIACASTVPDAVQAAGRLGHGVLFADYDGPRSIREKTDLYFQAARAAGRTLSREGIRVCRFVYVADSIEQAKDEVRATVHNEIEREKRSLPHHFAECLPPSGNIADITFDF